MSSPRAEQKQQRAHYPAERDTALKTLAKNGKSFYWASRLLGHQMTKDAAELYSLCRLLDDIADGDIEVKLAWRKGMLVFRGSSLDEAVREVGRYTHLEFVVQSEDLKAMRVAGVFKAGDVEGFLASLRANFDVVDRRIDEETIALSLKPSSSGL